MITLYNPQTPTLDEVSEFIERMNNKYKDIITETINSLNELKEKNNDIEDEINSIIWELEPLIDEGGWRKRR